MNKLYKKWEKVFTFQSHRSIPKKKDNRKHSQNDEFKSTKNLKLSHIPTNASETASIKTFRAYSEQDKILIK